ncbi:MAG: peptide chain release factor N(5)-glutamine methyltransferase [Candidatus Omnitrophica bacterium]|nr:peptide chain release factor N(5)-glutamine methyltransferase [Candidatus Omnitrophota bacterium]MCB9746909.1 peptide chain release factor N(5)-glutamine methyltransferase [Candidatus Omnitrophota bacterium]
MTEDEQMLTSILDCRRIDLFVDKKALTDQQESVYNLMRQRRNNGEPLQYILGHCEFMGLKLKVDTRVLIPRPETEIMVDEVLKRLHQMKYKRKLKILDIGTGSGNIAIALAKFYDLCHITAIDQSEEAVNLARENANTHACADKIEFHHQNMTSFFFDQINNRQRYDVVISNPPYIKTKDLKDLPADVQYEPKQALDGGEDGLDFFKFIVEYSQLLLNSNGLVMLECGDDQAPIIGRMFKLFPRYYDLEIIKDYTQTERIVASKFSYKTEYNSLGIK